MPKFSVRNVSTALSELEARALTEVASQHGLSELFLGFNGLGGAINKKVAPDEPEAAFLNRICIG